MKLQLRPQVQPHAPLGLYSASVLLQPLSFSLSPPTHFISCHGGSFSFPAWYVWKRSEWGVCMKGGGKLIAQRSLLGYVYILKCGGGGETECISRAVIMDTFKVLK